MLALAHQPLTHLLLLVSQMCHAQHTFRLDEVTELCCRLKRAVDQVMFCMSEIKAFQGPEVGTPLNPIFFERRLKRNRVYSLPRVLNNKPILLYLNRNGLVYVLLWLQQNIIKVMQN